MSKFTHFCAALTVSLISSTVFSQGTITRPPAVPLMTADPYFSVWSFANNPADDYTRHWTGKTMGIFLMVKVDGRTFRVIGGSERQLPAMDLKATVVNPTQTIYVFDGAGVELRLKFTTPLLPDSLDLISEDASYITWKVKSIDGKLHRVSVYFDGDGEFCVNTPDQRIVWGRLKLPGVDVMKMGSQMQPVLEKKGDDLRIDWGYVYFCSPRGQDGMSVIAPADEARDAFIQSDTLPSADDFNMPRQASDGWPVCAYLFNLGEVGANAKERFVLVAYDEIYSIEYFHRELQAYWKRNGATTAGMITERVSEYPKLMSECAGFDSSLVAKLAEKGGKDYASICALAYRQVFAAHKLVADIDGTPMLFPKEDFSNGCISTVDVIYPSAPFFMYFNNDLLKAILTPVFKYSEMPRWKFPFAPHDLGTYPKANGQVYGGGEKSAVDQMPVEESGNMIILTYAVCRNDQSADYAIKNWSSLEKWANYLKQEGLDPANQLCTDDFTGHLAHNANLSVKAIVALGCFSKICEMAGKEDLAKEYWTLATGYAKKWEEMDLDNDHYKLAFDKPGTWSMKYNMVWDKLFGLGLFSPDIMNRELSFYKTKLNKFGLPLDNRAAFTKPEWMTWVATMYPDKKDFEAYMHTIVEYLNDTPNRVPFSDWYDTETARQDGFQARSVIGGIFIKLLDK
jgi:Glutaminase A six helical-hairpin domain/Domain of unknown function (DUF5127)/Domain of unknown function (DUF4964)